MNTEQDVIALIEADVWMMDLLRTAQSLRLPDWWICAGFVRSKLWDTLHDYPERTSLPDVDVVYFDPGCVDEQMEKQWEQVLRQQRPDVPWSVKNEARMHLVNNLPPFASAVDAIAHFPETATALGVTLDSAQRVVLTAPWGLDDALQMRVRLSPCYADNEELQAIFRRRLAQKQWQRRWPRVTIPLSQN